MANQWMRNGKFTNFSEIKPFFDNQPTRSPGFSRSIGKIKSDYERAKITYEYDHHLKKYLPRRHTNGETGTSNEFDTLTNIAVLYEHQLRNNKKTGAEEQKSIKNPYRKELFGRSRSDSLEGLFLMKTRIKVSLGSTSSVELLEESCPSIETWFVTEQYISGVDEHTHALNASYDHDVFLLSKGKGLTAISECVSNPRKKHKIPVVQTKSQEVKERKPQRSCDQKIERNTLTKETKLQVENMLRELARSELTQFYMEDLPIQRR